ncbi:phosphatidate cytidylyltransferase [Marilutibacter aestuarii]|uniref:Phosphatidate cytidylyltransferase n=1 Tax=Marilutibacter aestuarii TaxID=1706195 RepID=A0A508ATR4_9GAMM|nr:phosphatidate cytidylyltransferase [Lysobacter aestuarii]TQD51098.1 phosphatidate cytidylyltransferase [Lysobacter aestuarii]
MTRTRLIAALVMAPLAIAAILLLPTPWFMALAAVVFLGGLWEWFDLADVSDNLARAVLLAANLALMVALVWASRSAAGFSFVLLQLVSVLGVAWWLLALLWLGRYDFASDPDSHARAIKLAAGTMSLVPAWCALAWIHGGADPNSPRWVFVALGIVWAADSGAYFAGRTLGKHKLAPRISPNKTIEGLVGGVLAGLVAGLGLSLFAGASLAQLPWIALAIVFAVLFSVVGDLFESLLKRHAGVKDSGHLIPGHGGILDRLDGVLAALPAFAVAKAVLGF